VTTSARWWVNGSEIAPENDQKTIGSLNLLAVTSYGYALSDSIGEEGLEPITFVELCSLDLPNGRNGEMEFRGLGGRGQRS
jgi:hypothetical protein